MTRILLVGNPNCGKTTLFNALTGDNQRVGNWPGVTVEQKTGVIDYLEHSIELIDLPGIYSLTALETGLSQDEEIAAQAIITLEPDCIINVVDACHLERHLYLTSQVLELGKPVILALNMIDIAEQRGITIDVSVLSEQLGCPVIPIQAHKKLGVTSLIDAILARPEPIQPLALLLPNALQNVLNTIAIDLEEKGYSKPLAHYHALRFAEGGIIKEQAAIHHNLLNSNPLDLGFDVLLADARYQKVHQMTTMVQKKRSDASEYFTAKLDKIVLHRFFALPIFFAMMYFMFLFAINIGGAFQDFFDISTDTIFVQGSAWLLQQVHAPDWITALIANGIGKGINTTLTFIPVITAMYFFLSLLETSGYMARAAFVVDKLMRILGLPGKSFVPMIVGFGCNVPAIMAARTLDTERDKLLTVMMSPFMSCSARLAIYAVFVAAFFPENGQNIVFSLYLIGILMAVLTGFLLRTTILKGKSSPLILELPAYHKPSFKRLLTETSIRLRFFVIRAGKVIIPVCVILGALNSLTLDGGISTGEASTQSLLSMIGQWITPLFAPMGITQDNWPATVGLLTGMLAKEVVIGTINTLYAQIGHMGELATAHFDFLGGIKAAIWSIPVNLSQLGSALWNPVLASAADHTVSNSIYGMMVIKFDGQVGAYAYLLFILLYIPCVSTMAVIRQEATQRLMWISVIWSIMVAYSVAVLFYQMAKFIEHPYSSMIWIITIVLSLMLAIGVFVWPHYSSRGRHAAANM